MNKQFSVKNNVDKYRIILENRTEGAYIFIYDSPQSKFPEWDYLDKDMQSAKEFCFEDYGTPLDSWQDLEATDC
jgi:hypothetical protein